MAYYENRHEHFDGALILYQRDLSIAVPGSKSHRKQCWYMKLKLGGKGRNKNCSTKLTGYGDAYEFAKGEFLRLQQAVRLGQSLDEFTFEEHWDDWYARNLRNNTWAEARQKWHQMYADRYFKAYFRHADGRSMLLNDISSEIAKNYWDWRIAYWSTASGEKLQKSNPKRRGAKTKSTNNAKKVPSKKTLDMEQGALNQILWDARERGRLQHVFKMKSPKSNKPHNRRPHFEDVEYRKLTSYLHSYREQIGVFKNDKLNAWHKLQRNQLYHFVLFMANSGLRVGEAREMRWRDIKFDQVDERSGVKIAVVGVRKTTKKGVKRDVQTQVGGNNTLKEWLEKSPYKGPDDYVWFGQKSSDGKATAITNLNKSFQNFLNRALVDGQEHGLLYNKENEKRSLYSLRHTYATMRREKGDVDMDDLALNMGCSRTQLEKHYSHATSNVRRQNIWDS
jgi:integrase